MFSIRADPLEWLLNGRLGIELESEVYKFISFELVPEFVTSELPPVLKQSFSGVVSQKSDGIGALSGAAASVGFWLNGKPLRGSVIRAIITNRGYRYAATDDQTGKEFDHVSHVERRFYGYYGSHSVWGPFTIAGGIGIGVELNKERRCMTRVPGVFSSNCPKDGLAIAMDPTYSQGLGDLNSWTYPIEFLLRLSLGVAF